MKKFIFSFIGFVALSMMCMQSAMAEDVQGSSCLNPIPLTEDFQMTISEPGSYWFSSWTYDLPLKVRYTPNEDTDEKLLAYVDFSCTPGVYDDPNLVELTDMASGWGIEMPISFTPITTSINGVKLFEISVNESHRELMRQFGISYDVKALVEVIVPVPGKVELVPDTVFRNCIESSRWLQLPDTIDISPIEWDNTYVFPLSDWVNDSIRITWTGAERPLTLWLGKDCSFSLDETDDLFACKFEIPAGGTLDFSANTLHDLQQYGSLLYAKLVSAETATLTWDYKPMSPEMARAIPMALDQPVSVKADDMEQYYYFKTELTNNSLQFNATKQDTIIAYFGTTPTFELESTDHVATFTLYPTSGGSQLALSKKQLVAFTRNVETEYMFVRFDAPRATDMTLSIWGASSCINNSIEILPNGVTAIAANSSSTIYRIDYYKWYQGDVELLWDGSQSVYSYLADTCSFTLSASNARVIDYKSIAKTNGTHIITKSLLDSVADRVDGDGYLYFRFNSRRKGNLTTTQTLDSSFINPVEPDLPAVPTTECSLSSLPLAQGDQVVLNLDSAFTVYRIDYKAWLKSGATLAWNGAEALHTFVAETCAFALAPYNRYVLAYIPVPAQGNIVLDANQLATMEEYVSEDGFLYIRFLTKEEGVLEVK